MSKSDDRRDLERTILQLDNEIARLRGTVHDCIAETKTMRRTIHGLKLLLNDKNIVDYDGAEDTSELYVEAQSVEIDDLIESCDDSGSFH